MSVVAFIPAHYPERFGWLAEAMASAQSADRVLIISSVSAAGESETVEEGRVV